MTQDDQHIEDPVTDHPSAPDYDQNDDNDNTEIGYRGTTSDPIFGLLLAGAVSIGLAPLVGSEAFDLRYTLVWGMLAGFGVLSWLIGSGPRIGQARPEDLIWGIIFALILVVPLLGFGGATFVEAAELLLRTMTPGTALAYLVFVMPLAETLFFRGLLQRGRPFWQAGLICTVWQMILFFPLIDVGPYPLVVGITLLMANLMYSYVRGRNGLAAAWLCQITVNLALIFFPFVTG